jgi:hypothetical protein
MDYQELFGKKLQYKHSNEPIQTVKEIDGNDMVFESNKRVPLNKVEQNFSPLDYLDDEKRASSFSSLLDGGTIGRIGMDEYESNEVMKSSQDSRTFQTNIKAEYKPSDEYINSQKLFKLEKALDDKRLMDIPINSQEIEEINRLKQLLGHDDLLPNLNPTQGSQSTTRVSSVPQPPPTNTGFNFSKLKRTQKVKLNITLNESIPKIESIRALNDMFEDSIIETLAKEIAYHYLSTPLLFEQEIAKQLEKLVYPSTKKIKTKE